MKIAENIKNTITNWFKSDRDYESGKQLYMRFGRNLSFRTTLNRVGKTKDNYNYLCYELARVVGISEKSYKSMLKQPLLTTKATVEEINDNKKVTELTVEEMAKQLELVNIDDLDWPTIQKLVSHLKLKPAGNKKVDKIAALTESKMQKLVSTVPDNVKRSIKLREEFPFLKDKACPGVLKELVSDMLTAYDAYIEGHKHLVEGVSQNEIEEISKSVVENYLENRQIWEELNHFKAKGELLGNHPIFEWMKRKAEIHAMDKTELVKFRDQLKNNLPRTKKQIVDEPDHKQTAKRQTRVDQFEKELIEVNILLGFNEE